MKLLDVSNELSGREEWLESEIRRETEFGLGVRGC